MYDTVVAIDLETTGTDAQRDRIIEVGAAVYRDGAVVERFGELAGPPVDLSPGIIKLTGITPEMLREARPLEDVLADFLSFLPADAPCIAHNAGFERAFLRRATDKRFQHVVIDTIGLSRICFPALPSHSLDSLRQALELPNADAHRALGDCETTLCLWGKILERAVRLPRPVLAEINRLLAIHVRHPYRDLFRRVEADAVARQFGKGPQSLVEMFREERAPWPRRELPPVEDRKKLDPEAIASLLAPDGPFAKRLGGYERRQEQINMAQAVAEAINESKHLMIEAGTGVGKSLAYLVPSVMWATTNAMPVVVATKTKNLQAQLFKKDLPLIRDALETPFKAALIKGRRNYLCLRKLFYLLRHADRELDLDERMRMVEVLAWAAGTETGDISESIVWNRPGFVEFGTKLTSAVEECGGRGCPMRTRCYLYRARRKSQAADVVVANHSVVFAEMGMESPVLPPYAHVIFDEAHNMEAVATGHFSVEVSLNACHYPLGRLWKRGRRGGGTGLLPSVLQQLELEDGGAHKAAIDQAVQHARKGVEAVHAADPLISAFFATLAAMLGAGRGRESVRLVAEKKRGSLWESLVAAKENLVSGLAAVMRCVEALNGELLELPDGTLESRTDFMHDLDAVVPALREAIGNLEFVLAADAEGHVFWIERVHPAQGGARAVGAPVRVGPKLHDELYAKKDTVVFSSATLSVNGSTDFLRGRLGIDRVAAGRVIEMDAGTPFDFPKQCLVVVPTFLPEPGEPDGNYARELGLLLSDVFRRTRGRAMALFTSYHMLRETTGVLEEEMLGDGIRILAQGMSGSRENITAVFKQDVHSVLMGTHSFWEGVDVAGEALSCLVMARLPFAVFTDPIIEARCQQLEAEGHDAFRGYSLPSAVIRFRQGFGRLIRHRTDLGVVIVADRRVVGRRYGEWFCRSLPAPTAAFPDRGAFLDAIEAFLEGGPVYVEDGEGADV